MSDVFLSYKPHLHQAKVHASTAQTRIIAAGRQSGKTVAAVIEITDWARSAPARWPKDSDWQFWWVTATTKTFEKAWRDLKTWTPPEIIGRKSEARGDYFIELRNGARISLKSADAEDSLVSEKLHGYVGDEYFQWKGDVGDQLLHPMLGTTAGPELLIGSPRGRNKGYEAYMRGVRGEPGYAAFHWTSRQSPFFAESEWLRNERIMPERIFRQEMLAEFLESGGEVFRNVDAAVREQHAEPDDYTVMGLDLARTRDWTVIWVTNGFGEWVDVIRVPHVDWSLQKPMIIEAYRRNHCRKVLFDSTGMHVGADAVLDSLVAEGLIVEPFKFSGLTKRALVETLMVRFDQGAISVPKRDDVTEEFKSFGFEVSASGHDKYEAPEGQHDDVVMAAGLAMWGIRTVPAIHLLDRRPKGIVEAELERIARGRFNESGWAA